jgi:hypothetical protein
MKAHVCLAVVGTLAATLAAHGSAHAVSSASTPAASGSLGSKIAFSRLRDTLASPSSSRPRSGP